MQYIVGLVYLVLSILPFLEQSVFSSVLRNIFLEKVCEIFMKITRLEHLPNASRITFIAFMVWEIRKSQGVTSALTEAKKVFYKEVVGNFVSFPTV
jgi:hypothetical protein